MRVPRPATCYIKGPDVRCRSKGFFFWMDGDTFFEVEGVIFRLHKAFLVLKSEWFAALFDSSAQNDPSNPMIVEGQSEQQPICLSGIKREEFEYLLGAMYHEDLASSSPISKDTLLAIFRLADMWLLDEIRAATLKRLSPHFSSSIPLVQIEKLRFATRYNISSWATEACMSLATRPAPLLPSETAELGPALTVSLMSARESIMKHRMRIAFGPESRWRCSGGEASRSRGCARQVLVSFRSALMAEIDQERCLFVVEGETISLDLTVSFQDAWNEIMTRLRLINRAKYPGLCCACAKSFGGGNDSGAMAWLDYQSDVEIVQREMRF
ncbi:putative glycerol-3-phosphate O-acyltransferase [Rhizoctonia solani 123E]|uniref:Putative glycerol-3-phosphate O-acyltransferase n=1 Tax=Rhizoctonia solani 123E TaxID=1423351 RepID=A0A074RXG4_9AGAM|nr:putative glycerol-3-phosphate O-acyltransferase [Rhizoctonia solani 123E]